MKIVEEDFWKSPGAPAVFVISAGKHDAKLFPFPIVNQAALRIYDFIRRAHKALEDPSGYVMGAEPSAGKAGWGILRVGYVEYPNLAAIGTAILDLDQSARLHPDWLFRMSFPGLEHLAQEAVEPLLGILPDYVTAVVHMKVPQLASGTMDIKDVYEHVKRHLMYGEHELAKEFLKGLGFHDLDGQVSAVGNQEREETWKRKLHKLRSPMG